MPKKTDQTQDPHRKDDLNRLNNIVFDNRKGGGGSSCFDYETALLI